jgi:hypothetical protein
MEFSHQNLIGFELFSGRTACQIELCDPNWPVVVIYEVELATSGN